jgi:hypothetical protein
MRQLNSEQKNIVYDILHKKNKHPTKPLHLFLTRGVGIGFFLILMCIIQNMLQYYIKNLYKC